jgi:hypothetical protein
MKHVVSCTTFQPILLWHEWQALFALIALYISFCFFFVLDLCVNEEGIGFIVDVFHHELKAIEKLHFK